MPLLGDALIVILAVFWLVLLTALTPLLKTLPPLYALGGIVFIFGCGIGSVYLVPDDW